MRFAAIRRWKNYRRSSHEEKKNSTVGPARSKQLTFTQKTVSAQIVIVSVVRAPVACSPTSSILASFTFSQLAPPVLSPLAAELLFAAAVLPIAADSIATTTARSTCPGCPIPDTFCAATAAASSYHRLRPILSGTRASRRRRCTCPGYPILSTLYVAATAATAAAFVQP
jgi:hypothetical protein